MVCSARTSTSVTRSVAPLKRIDWTRPYDSRRTSPPARAAAAAASAMADRDSSGIGHQAAGGRGGGGGKQGSGRGKPRPYFANRAEAAALTFSGAISTIAPLSQEASQR